MGILALSSLLVAGTGVYLLSRIWPNLSLNQKKLQKDIKLLRDEISDTQAQLIPLKGEEFRLMSDQEVSPRKGRGYKKVSKGIFTTIYGEQVLSYGYRKYLSGQDGLILAYTNDSEFIFWLRKKGGSRLVINEEFVAVLMPDGHFVDRPNGKEVIASLKVQANGMRVLTVGDREIATFTARAGKPKSQVQNRIFELVLRDLNALEQKLLWASILYELVQRVHEEEAK